MLKSLKALAKAREANGALSGRQITVGSRTVKVERLLGEGGFATIYRCTDAETGEIFALKHFILTGYPEAARDADQEVAVMERLSGCPCVVRLHEAALAGPPGAPTAAFALMDFCPDTLVAFLQQRGWRLDDADLLRVALPVARAVQAMHSRSPPLAHRDLKAENVLRGPSGRWVLCDFGSCSARHGVLESARDIALEEEVVRKYTTPAYRAPELYDLYAREYIGPPVDIWALGVLLYLLAFGRLPFEGEAKLQVLNGRYTMPEGRAPALPALIADMLRVGPRDRPTIHEVLPRLAAMAPPQLWEEFPDMADLAAGAQHSGAAAVAAASPQQQQQQQPAPAGWAAAQHGRAPSQGWADFAAEGSPAGAASSVHARQESGSGSWATFSPKRGEKGQSAAPAASAGSFWSSFGEEAPSEAQEAGEEAPAAALLLHEEEESASPKHQPLLASQQANMSQPAAPPPPQQPHHHSQSAPQRLVAAAAAAAASVASVVTRPLEAARTPPPAHAAPRPAAAAAPQPVDASPLSAGLSRMSRVSQHGEASVAKPPAPTPSTASAPASSSGTASAASAQRQAGLSTAPTPLSAGGARQPSIGEAEALRQHSLVLEELLESRKEEIERLQRLVEQQGAEIKHLRQQLQAAQQALNDQQRQQQRTNGLAQATPVQAAAAAPPVAATPASSRLGQAPRLEVPGGSGNPSGASSPSSRAEASPWVSFSAAGGGGDGPTPTLLQPSGGSMFADSGASSSRRPGDSVGPAAAGASGAAAAAATPASAASVAPLEEQFRSQLDLSLQGSSGRHLARAASGDLQRQKPMRSNSSGGLPPAALPAGAANGVAAQQQQQQQAALRSFPVPLTPGTSMLSDGPRSAPPSAQPSPLRAGPQPGLALAARGTAAGGALSLAQLGSPMHSVLSAARSGSPSKHRRHMTAPDGGFFGDLNPLQH